MRYKLYIYSSFVLKSPEKTSDSMEILDNESRIFDLVTIKLVTDNFSEANKLGEGGFGSVYKSTVEDGRDIAMKRLLSNSKQGIQEFKNEISLLIKLQHRNLVRSLGFFCKMMRNC
ncbi:hypothetical protein ZOSMA_41G00280 [Zostera marina]|uniref:Protein kinase domain-containing protein n=1 Tax=Zostera marina TaxID=29655 RepID=A0A0K9P4U0_ZOSMR|nr:hypothetical protein ZOSMA_41G00280 [Zostera marina]